MPYVNSGDTRLYYEEEGHGTPIVFLHEMTGDLRVWEHQIRYFSRFYRCIAFNARGYAPSDIPTEPGAYSQAQAAADVAAVIDGLGLDRPHVVGLSMGGYTALHVGIRYAQKVRSLVVAGCGHGSARDAQAIWAQQAREYAEMLDRDGMAAVAGRYSHSPYRVQFRDKNRRGWQEWATNLADHDPRGLAMSVREVQGKRPSVLDLENELRAMSLPVLLVAGDEDEPVLEMNLYMKRSIQGSGLLILPKTGHAVNSEEVARFNLEVADFFHRVELGRWTQRSDEAIRTEVWLPQGN